MKHYNLLCLLILLSQNCSSWGWLFTSKDPPPSSDDTVINNDAIAEFSMEPLSNPKGMKLVENAQRKVVSSNSCWQNAYMNLFSGCSEILAAEEKRSRLAWHLSDCFQKDSGRPGFPLCDSKSLMVNCLKKLDEDARKIYLEFYLETNSICHQLQTDAFKQRTERLVNELKKSAEYAESKLETIEEQAEHLSRSSNQIDESLNSINLHTHQLAQTSKNVEDRVINVLKHSEAVHEQSKGIAASQMELREGQVEMKAKFEEGIEMLEDSYKNLGVEIDNLKNEAVEIEKEIEKVGDTMAMKMKSLQNKADDIGNIAGVSLDRQKQLLDGQSVALEGLQFLTKFQSQALEESRGTLQQLAEFGHRQQEELLKRQEQLEQSHDNLVQNSKTILAAQEAFESKQASMFLAIDKLFALHNAILLESRLIKAFFIYSISIFILYMFTSTKQTYTVRPRLYIGLCATFLIEAAILRYTENDLEQQAWIISAVRSLFALLAVAQLLYAICTYRDYEVLNHHMLLQLIEKVNGIQRNKELSWDDEGDSEADWSTWVEAELPEDVDKLEDPDYTIPEEVVGENWVSTTTSIARTYNLRTHHRRLQSSKK
ncbi:hypothetical protein LguiA_018306 [Lonicera macranthoides]